MEMIKAAGLKKYYVTDNYEVHALDGVSLSVEEGEFLDTRQQSERYDGR